MPKSPAEAVRGKRIGLRYSGLLAIEKPGYWACAITTRSPDISRPQSIHVWLEGLSLSVSHTTFWPLEDMFMASFAHRKNRICRADIGAPKQFNVSRFELSCFASSVPDAWCLRRLSPLRWWQAAWRRRYLQAAWRRRRRQPALRQRRLQSALSFKRLGCMSVRRPKSFAKWWPLAYQTSFFNSIVFSKFLKHRHVLHFARDTLLAWIWRCLNPCFAFCKGS